MSDEGEKPEENEPQELEDFEAEAERIMGDAKRPGQLPDVPEWEYSRPDYTKKHLEQSDMSGWRMGGVGLTAAYSMIGCVVGGFGLGWLLDGGSDSMAWRAILTLVGAVLGLGFAVFIVLREQAREDK
ncbi:MAG: AtpZ/AtpI family protein [Fimbriimonadales bacterium]